MSISSDFLYNLGPDIWGLPPKNWGPKTFKIWRHVGQLQMSIANISGKSERHVIDSDSSRVVEKSPVNFGSLR